MTPVPHESWCQSQLTSSTGTRPLSCNCGAFVEDASPCRREIQPGQWYPMAEAPHDRPVNVWLGDADEDDVDFYCVPGTRFSAGWKWDAGKFRPMSGLRLTVTVQPTHWRPIPKGPEA